MQTVSVIIPVYNEEESLPALLGELNKLRQSLKKQKLELELLFVDDGSIDATVAGLRSYKKKHKKVRVVKLTRNFGATQASKAALDYVSGDCFTFLPADLQDPPSLVEQMAVKWQAGAKYVVSRRSSRQDSIVTRLFAFLFYRLVKMMILTDFPARGFDLFLMDRQLLPYLRDGAKNVNRAIYGYWLGYKPEYIEYERAARTFGKSKWSLSKKIKLLIDSIVGFSIVPVRIMTVIGFLCALASFAYGATVIVGALLGRVTVQGFAATVTLISFFSGLILIMLGILGEYLWRIFDEVNKKPEAVIDEVY